VTPRDLAEVLSRVPEKRLKLFDLARECLGPDGELDVERVTALAGELDDAFDEAETYGDQIQKLRDALARLTRP
jgi:hypothetical protein